MPKLSAVIIAFNEEKNIEECISSVGFCDEIVVVDSGSSDKTVELAEKMGARVYPAKFVDYASQKNFGIEKTSGEWMLSVDADERVTRELASEIKKVLEDPRADGFYLPRHNQIFGRWMRYGANRDDFQLRLVKKEKAVFEGQVHERIYSNGAVPRLRNPLLHYSTRNLSDYMKKLNTYTSLEANVLEKRRSKISSKELKLKPLAVFLYRTVRQRGFLDGLEGFFFGVLSAYYEFVRQAKCWERAGEKYDN